MNRTKADNSYSKTKPKSNYLIRYSLDGENRYGWPKKEEKMSNSDIIGSIIIVAFVIAIIGGIFESVIAEDVDFSKIKKYSKRK